MANYALQFDGNQNYVSLGTMGNLGSNLGSGFYMKFNIQTTQTTIFDFGVYGGNSPNSSAVIYFNADQAANNVSGKIRVFVQGGSGGGILCGATTSATTYNNGSTHTIEVIINVGSQTVAINFDGASQAISYENQNTITGFNNFIYSFVLGARYDQGTIDKFGACTLDNVLIGTTSSSLYGVYYFNDGSGITTLDSSGSGNTGTLGNSGGANPAWVAGLGSSSNISTAALLGV
jgi:hypothetical protein